MLLTSIRLAIRGLNRNRLRTLLTMLGMIIGVAAVMTMVALGNGAQHSVEQDVRSAGTNLIHVNAGNYTRGGEESRIATGLGAATTLTPADAEAIGRDVVGIKALAAGVKLRGWMAAGARRFYGPVLGTDVPLALMFGWHFDEGRFFAASDVAARRPVVVLGRTTRDQIFGPGAKVVGLAAARGLSHYLHWSTTISPAAVLLSVGVAAAVGVFFGWYPAKEAARLDPIQSLRYE